VKDAFGQRRAKVSTRETAIGLLFVVTVAIGVWSVALPALDQDPAKDDPETTSESAETNDDSSADTEPEVKDTPAQIAH
jgi:hypothetical protein